MTTDRDSKIDRLLAFFSRIVRDPTPEEIADREEAIQRNRERDALVEAMEREEEARRERRLEEIRQRAAGTFAPPPPDVVHVAITNEDGSLAVMQFVTCEYYPTGKPRWTREATDDAIQHEITRSILPHIEAGALESGKRPLAWRRIDPAHLPQDRTFREAWRDHGHDRGIGHDMAHVRRIALERVRQARAPKLEALDREWMKAAGRPRSTASLAAVDDIEVQRQRLRDLPATLAPALDAATTPEQVLAVLAEVE